MTTPTRRTDSPFTSVGTGESIVVMRGDEVGTRVESSADIATEFLHAIGKSRNLNPAAITPPAANTRLQNLFESKKIEFENELTI